MKNIFFFLAIMCVTFVIISCKSGTSPSSSASIQDIFPLKVGNAWVYAVTEYNSSGIADSPYADTALILGSKTYQGVPAFEYLQAAAGSGDTLLLYYGGTTDLYTVQNGSAMHDLHYPMNVGDTYVIQDNTNPDGSIQKEILILQSVSESVSVPAGSFSTFHFDDLQIGGTSSALDTPSIRKEYYVLDKGMVQENDYGYDQYKNHYLVNSVQLQSYQIK